LTKTTSVIGRREDCDLRIPLAEVSRKHCRIIVEEDLLRLEDLGSSNGTYVNNQRVQEAAINPGDILTVGPVSMVVQINGVPADEEIQPMEVNPNTDTSLSGSDQSGQANPGDSGQIDLVDLDDLEK
jgi:pSer/pThr/pTyr-binding forkhead associated (FHA) protein